MPEVVQIEPKHLAGKGGIGKGSQLRHGADLEAFERGYVAIDWSNGDPSVAVVSSNNGRTVYRYGRR